MSIPVANMTVLWGADNPTELLDIGTLKSMNYEDSIDSDAVADLLYVNCPFQVADRPELQGGQVLLLSWGRGASFNDPVSMVIEEPVVTYGSGIRMKIRCHDAGTELKGIQKHRVWTYDLEGIVTRIASAWGLQADVEPYTGLFPIVQARESDYAYLDRIAKRIGYRFWIDNSTLRFRVDSTEVPGLGAPLIRFVYRSGNLLKRFEVTPKRQQVKASQKKTRVEGFDPATGQVVSSEATPDTDTNTRLAGGAVIVDPETGEITDAPGAPSAGASVSVPESDETSVAQIAQGLRQDKIKGQQTAVLEAPGVQFVKQGTFIVVEGVAESHAGIWRVKKSKHPIGKGYTMRLDLDRENIGLTSGPGIEAAPAQTVSTQEAAFEDDEIIDAESGTVLR